ncbi:MAG: PDZ domain-containing protein [Myxococcales bacterium]|nr:PDZ domain-containing protein [Myxococcales bacterium]
MLPQSPPRSLRHGLALLPALLLASTHASALPALPGPNASAAPAGEKAPEAPAAAPNPAEAARKALVLLESNGRPVGVGTVLGGDGRVLTALSAVGASELLDVRYADGSVVKAKLGHRDKAWDLALLVPQAGRWKDGLPASEADPTAVELKTIMPVRGKAPTFAPVQLKMRTDAKSKDGDTLPGVLDLDLKGTPVAPGMPIADPSGGVLGVLVRACKMQDGPCIPVSVVAPVSAIRTFLMKTPANAVAPAPWLGIGGAAAQAGSAKGVRVLALAPGSPAEKSGLKAGGEGQGDLIVAVDGQPVDSPEALAEVIGKRQIGQAVKLLVFGGDKFREVGITLRPPPDPK